MLMSLFLISINGKDNIFFVVRSHAAPGYSKPTFSSSKITEVVFGEFVKVLSKKGKIVKSTAK